LPLTHGKRRPQEATDMNRLQLATLLSWAGDNGLQGRKRLQKVVFFLQEAGCPLDCEYTLHHFGPYSRDVADRSDEMVTAGLLHEKVEVINGLTQYTYSLSPAIRGSVLAEPDRQVESFRSLGSELMDPARTNLWWLELGSTILFYLHGTKNWSDAFAQACKFKKVAPEDKASQLALELARRFHRQAVN
jgi:uncharacterized protein